MAIKDENGKVTGWSFAILGSDARRVTKFIGFKETYEDASNIGPTWQRSDGPMSRFTMSTCER